jgi:hypothetical protein
MYHLYCRLRKERLILTTLWMALVYCFKRGKEEFFYILF